MISFFHKIGTTWVAKFIFLALGISMLAFWGLGGLSNTVTPDSTAIKVGRRSISTSELRKAFDNERAKLSQMTGQYVSPKQAIQMGLLQQVIQNQITDTINQQIQDDLDLTASDSAVRKYVERHPVFQDALGHFDRNLFNAYLTQMKMSENELSRQLRNELANQHLSNTLKMVAPYPSNIAAIMWQHENEKRDVEALLIEQDKIVVSQQPTSEELKDYYEAYLDQFMSPETRDIRILLITPESVAKNIQISESTLDEMYQEQKANFEVPEKRHVYQIRFNDKEKAEQARQKLNTTNFVSIAKENGQTDVSTDFGFVAKSELAPELAEVAFNMSRNTISEPIESTTGWHILWVNEVQKAQVANKSAVYAQLRDKLVADSTYDTMYETARKVEDLLGEGKTLDATATELKLNSKTIKGVDISGEALPKEFKNQELLQNLFVLNEKEATPLLEHNNGFVVAEVIKINPAHARDFADVKSDVKKLWLAEQQKTLLPEIATKALEQFKNGTIPAKLGQVIVAKNVARDNAKDIPELAIDQLFAAAKGYENAVQIPLPNGVLIAVVKQIKTPAVDDKQLPQQNEKLAAETAQALYSSVVADYADRYGVKVNTDTIQKAFAIYQDE